MRTTFLLALAAALGCAAEIDERETIRQSFPATGELVVRNVIGAIRVTAQPGGEVQAVIEKRITAESPAKAEEARRDVRLEMGPSEGAVRFAAVYPKHDVHGYTVRYDFDLKVPEGTRLKLTNVTGGAVTVENTTGDYEISNVNGAVEMREVSGAGSVRTVNGKVAVRYRANPRAACSFKTVNGPVEVWFQPGLAAGLQFKTLNGGVWADFPVTHLPRVAAAGERRNGRFVYRGDSTTRVRAGAGGPELSFETVNGAIQIRSREN